MRRERWFYRLPPATFVALLAVAAWPCLSAENFAAEISSTASDCVITRPAEPLPVGRPVTLEARIESLASDRLVARWHLGGGAQRQMRGEFVGDEVISTSVIFERGNQVFPVTLTLTDSVGRASSCRAPIPVGDLPLSTPGTAVVEEDPPGDPTTQGHAVLAFNDLGMHAMDVGSTPFSLRPPLNVLHAQVVERGAAPRLLDDTVVELRYSAASSLTDPVVTPLVVDLAGPLPLLGRQGFAARELVSAAAVVVTTGADVRFTSGEEVRLASGFTVESGALFEIAIDGDVEAPSINSTSRHDPPGTAADAAWVRKSDLWDPVDMGDPLGPTVVATLFGVDPPPDEGLATLHNPTGGRRMPGFDDPYFDNLAQPFSAFDATTKRFLAEGIPLTPIDDWGRLNPYPILRIQAIDVLTEATLATIDAVASVSTGVDCRDCHLPGGPGADPVARAVEIEFVEPATFGDPVAEERAAKQNILLLHDFKHGSEHAAGPTTLCASCHESQTLEALFPVLIEPGHLSLSNVMHDQHGRFVVDAMTEELVRAADGEPILRNEPEVGERFLIPSDPTDPMIGMEQNCFSCHPGQETPYFRGVMAAPAGLKCSQCHGTMLAVGALFDGDFDASGTLRRRQPWRDEPRCESCHLGDAVDPGVDGLPATLAFDVMDAAATPTRGTNDRFAETPGLLYKDSHGHGGVACAGCHGSPHAVWPHADPAANDNVTALALQGAAGRVTDCVVCHPAGSFPGGTLDGPHGLHPVADPDWIESTGSWHKAYAEAPGDDLCAPCHGSDHLGTRLSRASTDRELRSAKHPDTLLATVAAGEVVTCALCHPLAESF